jgi:hypothetical protein
MNLLSGLHEWLGTWENACLQGKVAGENMAGKDAYYPGSIPQNIGPLFEWTYAQLGDVQPHGESVRHFAFGDPVKGGHLVLAFRQHVLTGANLINCTHLAGKLKRAILQKWRRDASLQHPFTVQGVERALSEAADDFRGLVTEQPSDALRDGTWGRREIGPGMRGIRRRQ